MLSGPTESLRDRLCKERPCGWAAPVLSADECHHNSPDSGRYVDKGSTARTKNLPLEISSRRDAEGSLLVMLRKSACMRTAVASDAGQRFSTVRRRLFFPQLRLSLLASLTKSTTMCCIASAQTTFISRQLGSVCCSLILVH